MREKVKNYELSATVDMYRLTKSGFKRVEHADEESFLQYHFSIELQDKIILHIDIRINNKIEYLFYSYIDIEIFDEAFCHPYNAFYDEDRDFPFLNDLIKEYNETMDGLVEKGVLEPKKIKKNKTLKKTK